MLTVNGSLTVAGAARIGGAIAIAGPVNVTSLLVNSTLQVMGASTVQSLTASGLIAGNAGVAATSLISANLTLNSLFVTGLVTAGSIAAELAIWTPALRYNTQPVLFSGYSDISTGTGEACSVLC